MPIKINANNIIAVICYNPEAKENEEFTIVLTKLTVGMLNTLTDFELKVFATEASLRLRKALEMPPSPNEIKNIK